MKRLDIAIAGCGVAGLACASLLRRQGARVVVFDRLETPQPLGSGLILQPVGLRVLEEIGVRGEIENLGAPLARLYGQSVPSQRVVLDVRYRDLGKGAELGLSVHRGALFHVLYEAARAAGAELESQREVVGVGEGRIGFANGGESARFDLVIDALGMRSPLSRPATSPLPYGALWASLDWRGGFAADALEQRYEAARKMAGVMPIGRLPGASQRQAAFFWSLKHSDLAQWRERPLDAWKDEVRALWPETHSLLDQIDAREQIVFATYAHRTLASPLGERCVHVGDSWHCASPQLGQGANMALLDAFALAHALQRQPNLDVALSEYQRLRLWHIRLYQLTSWLFTPAYQSDSTAVAWLRDMIVSPLSRLPPGPRVLAALVAGAWGAPLGAIGLTRRRGAEREF